MLSIKLIFFYRHINLCVCICTYTHTQIYMPINNIIVPIEILTVSTNKCMNKVRITFKKKYIFTHK